MDIADRVPGRRDSQPNVAGSFEVCLAAGVSCFGEIVPRYFLCMAIRMVFMVRLACAFPSSPSSARGKIPVMQPAEILGLAAAAAAAGAINAVAGGGTLITFPVLIFFGTPKIVANATSTLALVIGTVSCHQGLGTLGGRAASGARSRRPW